MHHYNSTQYCKTETVFSICYNQIAQIWCQSKDGILSQQLFCSEVTSRHAQVVQRRFFTFHMGQHLGASARDTVAFLEQERDARNASSSKRLCPCTWGTFWAQILTILSPTGMTTNTLLNKPYSVYCVPIQLSDSLLQIIHFNVM